MCLTIWVFIYPDRPSQTNRSKWKRNIKFCLIKSNSLFTLLLFLLYRLSKFDILRVLYSYTELITVKIDSMTYFLYSPSEARSYFSTIYGNRDLITHITSAMTKKIAVLHSFFFFFFFLKPILKKCSICIPSENTIKPEIFFFSNDFLHYHFHCVKSGARIRSYSGLHFSCIFLHSDWMQSDTPHLSIFSPNGENVGKMRTKITPNMDTFYPVLLFKNWQLKK